MGINYLMAVSLLYALSLYYSYIVHIELESNGHARENSKRKAVMIEGER
jgi:hypothetical protein